MILDQPISVDFGYPHLPPSRAWGAPWSLAGWIETAGVRRIPVLGRRAQRSGVGRRPNPLPSRCARLLVEGPPDERLNGHCVVVFGTRPTTDPTYGIGVIWGVRGTITITPFNQAPGESTIDRTLTAVSGRCLVAHVFAAAGRWAVCSGTRRKYHRQDPNRG